MSGHTPVCEDEAKVKPPSPPKRGKLGKTRGVIGDVHEPGVGRALRFVTALLDFTLYSFLKFPTHLGPLDLYLDSHRTIVNAHDSPHIITPSVAIVLRGEPCV